MFQKLNRKNTGFTLVEIMVVVAIIALLAAIAVPGFLRARLRSQATLALNTLRLLDAAKDQYFTENGQGNAFNASYLPASLWDVKPYLKDATLLYNACSDPSIAPYQDWFLAPNSTEMLFWINPQWDTQPDGGLPAVYFFGPNPYSDVVDASFWSPYSLISF